jgi:DNA-binding NtrC family response regulator
VKQSVTPQSSSSHYTRHADRQSVRPSDPSYAAWPHPAQFKSATYRAALARVERFAKDRYAPILIEGESGTGKTTLARYLHERSPRASGPFHALVLSTLDDSLASSELFGHVAGAFTDARSSRAGHFVSAAGGTLFLDEIGKASKAVQQKLLHAVETGEIRAVGSDRDVRVDVRVVLACNVPLQALVADGSFLPDLYARVGNFRIVLPPLRERKADIPMLIEHYVDKHASRYGYDSPPAIDPSLLDALQSASWPGNMRQLDATIHRLVIDAAGANTITLDHCIEDLAVFRDQPGPRTLTTETVDCAISRAGSISGAARLLGVDRTTVHRFQRRRDASPQPFLHRPVAPHTAGLKIPVAPHNDADAEFS